MTLKALRATSGAVFGPFAAITETTEHFSGDGVLYPKSVVGDAAIEDWVEPTPPTAPAPVPASISRVQLILGMTSAGLITPAEAVAAAAGTAIPAVVEAVFASLPEAQATAARIRWHAMTRVERANPLVAIVAVSATPPKTDAEMDQFFREWNQL
jgi:hypothetical protein